MCLWYSGAPLAAAVVGVFAYRILVLWLPLPVALASLPTLRTMGERRIAQVFERTRRRGLSLPTAPACPSGVDRPGLAANLPGLAVIGGVLAVIIR